MRDEVGSVIDLAAAETTRSFDKLPQEDRLTGEFFGLVAAFQKLRMRSGTTAHFDYRTFDGTTEREVGADGAILISVRDEEQTRKKVLLFQAKRLTGQKSRTQLTIPAGKERKRLARQLRDLSEVARTGGAVGLFYTRAGIYVVDAVRLLRLAEEDESALRKPLVRKTLPVLIGDCIADLALACRIGNTSPTLLREVERDGLKSYAKRRFNRRLPLRHRLEIRVRIKKRTTVGSVEVEPDDDMSVEDEHDTEEEAQAAGAASPRAETKRLPAPSRAFDDFYHSHRKREEVPSLLNLFKNLLRRKSE
jgi:hypothetical protein